MVHSGRQSDRRPVRGPTVFSAHDVRDAIRKEERKWISVSPEVPPVVSAGQTLNFKPRAYALEEFIERQLISGPKGMKVLDDGTLTWTVPEGVGAGTVKAVVRFSTTQHAVERSFLIRTTGNGIVSASKLATYPGGIPRWRPADQQDSADPLHDGDSVIQFPGKADRSSMVGDGRFLVFRTGKQLTVVDLLHAQTAGFIPIGNSAIDFAAGRSAVLTYQPSTGIVERWNLHNLTLEKTQELGTIPKGQRMSSQVMSAYRTKRAVILGSHADDVALILHLTAWIAWAPITVVMS